MIELYLNPPQHAAVFSVDEKIAIQALDRKAPVLPLLPRRVGRPHGSNTSGTSRRRCTLPTIPKPMK